MTLAGRQNTSTNLSFEMSGWWKYFWPKVLTNVIARMVEVFLIKIIRF